MPSLKQNQSEYYRNSSKIFVNNFYAYINEIADTSISAESRQQYILDAVSDFFETENDIVVNDSLFEDAQEKYSIKDYLTNIAIMFAGSKLKFEIRDTTASDIFDLKDHYLIIVNVKRVYSLNKNNQPKKDKKSLDFYLSIIPHKEYKFIGFTFHEDNLSKFKKANVLVDQNEVALDSVKLGKKTAGQQLEEQRKIEEKKQLKEADRKRTNKEKGGNVGKGFQNFEKLLNKNDTTTNQNYSRPIRKAYKGGANK